MQLWSGGDPDGATVVFFHGAPDTRWAARSGADAASRQGVRLVAFNRPGYGGSDACASGHVTVADDVVAACSALGIGPFAVLGMSLGGPYALAAAARHPQRVRRAAIVAAPAMVPALDPPVHRDDLDPEQQAFFAALAGMSPDAAAAALRSDFEAFVAQLPLDASDERLAAAWLDGLPEGERIAFASLTEADIAASVREALARPDGYLQDAVATFRPWSFDVRDVSCPVGFWYGAKDDNVSPRKCVLVRRHDPGGPAARGRGQRPPREPRPLLGRAAFVAGQPVAVTQSTTRRLTSSGRSRCRKWPTPGMTRTSESADRCAFDSSTRSARNAPSSSPCR
jgi:pimeloyl-ACP methyl ester carboxylesterase